ncbi:MAG TPA: chemotaxis response regulator protein-glutamate methylesterase [Peptococcaceae bacterium]|nr:chemotaxis response regulator protein-glutamate methylesterase [Peptococcaceae bacterium]
MHKRLKPCRVLIVDDSPFIRMMLKSILERDPEIEVVGTARDGREGIKKLQALKPDVVTMDVEMPEMNGLQALDEIMRWQPTPVIVLSALTTAGAKLTLKALELGAVEVVAKPSGQDGDNLNTLAEDLVLKVKSVAGIDPARVFHKDCELQPIKPKAAPLKPAQAVFPAAQVEIVALGTSTGGPTALQAVLTKLPRNFPVPLVIAQHMPPGFTASLAARLDNLCQIKVKEAEDGEALQAGTAYIGPSGKQFAVKRSPNGLVASVWLESPPQTLYKPSVDVLLCSLAGEVGAGVLAVIMTGMGHDGLEGAKKLKAQGAFLIAESEKTSVVYGMPRSVVEAGLADRIELLPDIPRVIIDCVSRR